MRNGFYVASRTTRAAMWRAHRDVGRVPIASTWIDEAGEGQTGDLGELWVRIADEVRSSCGVVLYAEPEDFPLKGALVEVGMAITANVRICVVLPGVEVDAISCRPIGSWIRHPLVRRVSTCVDAFEDLRKRGDFDA